MSKRNKHSSVVTTVVGTGKTKCHTGNVAVMHSSKKGGGSLYCGGWSRGAFSDDMAVIDLTGTEPIDVENPLKAKNDSAAQWFGDAIALSNEGRVLPWLAFKIRDFGVPTVGKETWVALSEAISKLMGEGHDILIACNGGHGRTGTAASILCYLLNSKIGDPVTYLRGIYCKDAVETYEQHKYVNEMLGLPVPEKIEYKHDPVKAGGLYQGWYGGGYGTGSGVYQGSYQPGYEWDNIAGKWMPPGQKKDDYDGWQAGYVKDSLTGKWKPPEEKKGETWWQDDLTAMLDSLNIDYVLVYNERHESHVEVSMPEGNGLAYYRVTSYDKQNRTVRMEDANGSSRQAAVEFLTTKEEVEAFYEKGQ